jgi:hypothetical protein
VHRWRQTLAADARAALASKDAGGAQCVLVRIQADAWPASPHCARADWR